MRVIALAQQKGGVGKSALAINLAGAVIATGKTAVIVDLDPQGTAKRWRDRRQEDDIRVVVADANRLDSVLSTLEKTTDWVFIDLPGRQDAVVVGGAMKRADLVLIPARPLDVDIEAAAETVKSAQRLNRKYAFVMNIASGEARARTWLEHLQDAGHRVAPVVIQERIEVADAIGDGKTVQQIPKSKKSADEVAKLFTWIREKGVR